MNKVFLIGNITKDPELSETPNGTAFCKFDLAVNRDYENGEGNRDTDFFKITVWRGRAESCGKYLKKGSKVAIIGALYNRSYEDNDGVKRYVTDVVAYEVEFLNTPRQEAPAGSDKYDKNPKSSDDKGPLPALEPVDDNKLPF